LYAIGGLKSEINGGIVVTILATVERYDPATNAWSSRTPLPSPRSGLGAGVINGTIYVVGGADPGGVAVATVEAYDPATDTWTPARRCRPRAPAPSSASSTASCTPAAEQTRPAHFRPSRRTIPATNTWTTKSRIGLRAMTGQGGAIESVLYVTPGGGLDGYAYDAGIGLVDHEERYEAPS
jgi:N-acetylneuraminic acid mutarotase